MANRAVGKSHKNDLNSESDKELIINIIKTNLKNVYSNFENGLSLLADTIPLLDKLQQSPNNNSEVVEIASVNKPSLESTGDNENGKGISQDTSNKASKTDLLNRTFLVDENRESKENVTPKKSKFVSKIPKRVFSKEKGETSLIKSNAGATPKKKGNSPKKVKNVGSPLQPKNKKSPPGKNTTLRKYTYSPVNLSSNISTSVQEVQVDKAIEEQPQIYSSTSRVRHSIRNNDQNTTEDCDEVGKQQLVGTEPKAQNLDVSQRNITHQSEVEEAKTCTSILKNQDKKKKRNKKKFLTFGSPGDNVEERDKKEEEVEEPQKKKQQPKKRKISEVETEEAVNKKPKQPKKRKISEMETEETVNKKPKPEIEVSTRSSRHKKIVTYVEPSLRRKMRR